MDTPSRTTLPLVLVLLAAIAGFTFASFSTLDSVQHLDRDVHALHCSFTPGLAATDATATSGCHTVLMSPYSSVLRTRIWGGIPVALAAMGVFAFLAARALWLLVDAERSMRRSETLLLLLASLIPLGSSIVMGTLAAVKVGAFCKLCVGIYLASIVGFGAALFAFIGATPGAGTSFFAFAAMLGAFVAVPVGAFALSAPDHARYVGQCGHLEHAEDPYGVMVPLPASAGAVPAIEVMDPLCPACKAFESRLSASDLDSQVRRNLVLFPLDHACNWMVGTSLHPGACAVSEAVLCAGPRATDVLTWAMREQEAIREASGRDPSAAARLVAAQFPDLASCVGSAQVRARLNRSLRWVVSNRLNVLTPQFFVAGEKLCDEDTDLGLDFALSRLIERRRAGAAGGAR